MQMNTRLHIVLPCVLLAVVFLAGCDSPDREPIRKLLSRVTEDVTRKLRPELNGLHGAERGFTAFRDESQETYMIIDDFLASGPPISDNAREMVVAYRDAAFSAYQHYDTLLSSENLDLSEDEFKEGTALMYDTIAKMDQLGQFLKDGDLD